jgi:hypothetical protein
MQREQEAVAYCPTSQLCGGNLVPDPPGSSKATAAAAAPTYAEIKLQLVDFSQVTFSEQAARSQLLAGTVGWSHASNSHPLPALQVRDMTGDGSVVKRTLRKGQGEFPVDCPLEDSSVRVHYRRAWPPRPTACPARLCGELAAIANLWHAAKQGMPPCAMQGASCRRAGVAGGHQGR